MITIVRVDSLNVGDIIWTGLGPHTAPQWISEIRHQPDGMLRLYTANGGWCVELEPEELVIKETR